MQATRGLKSNPFTTEERQEIAERLGMVRHSMRNGRGMLQAEMAELLEVSHSHYSKCESGHNSFSAKLLDKLCERTGVSRTWLTSGEGSMYSHSPKADSGLGQAIAGLHGDGRASSAQLSEGLVKRVLACAKDSRVVAAAEALSDATETTYDDALALVVVRRLAAEQ